MEVFHKNWKASFLVLWIVYLLIQINFASTANAAAGTVEEERTEDMLEYYILEELPADTLIGNVAVDAKLADKYDRDTLAELRYGFLHAPDSDLRASFAMDNVTSIVRTTAKIDRDTLCPTKATCIVRLDVAVTPAKYFQVIKIILEVLDINDHVPSFNVDGVQHTLSESAPAGSTSFSLPMATDPDSSKNSVERYELVGDNTGKFELREVPSVDGSTDLRLFLKSQLDREDTDFYKLTLVAHDGGSPSKSGSVIVNITVEDANDNDPQFQNSTYEVFVMENVQAGTTVARVTAKDKDAGLNGDITYKFSSTTITSYGNLFAIVNKTGAIYLKQSLDFESRSTYLLTVIASDRGVGSHPAHATVILRVEDDNDNSPLITVNTLTDDGAARISESAPIGTFVAHLSVQDKDGGNNGQLQCSLDHSSFQLQELNTAQYKVITKLLLDYEKVNEYLLDIRCSDQGRHPRDAHKRIKVLVLDENDHRPTFSKDRYEAQIRENNEPNMVIVSVNATDSDTGSSGLVRYKIADDTLSEQFFVNPLNGEVQILSPLDYEKSPEINLPIVAYDMGKPALSSTTIVHIKIQDENDQSPVFSQKQFAFGVFENEPPNTEVGKVIAFDADAPPYNHFEFSFVSDAVYMFTIDARSGRIATRQTLDREKQPVYYILVQAISVGVPLKTSSASVTVYVADRNDNEPMVEYPNSQNNTFQIADMVPIGYEVIRVKAVDLDIGGNGKLTYKIADSGEIFGILENTGVVYVKKDIKHATKDTYEMTVTVQDHGYPQNTVSTSLTIVLNHSLVYEPSWVPTPSNNQYLEMEVVVGSLVSAFGLLFILLAVVICICHKQGILAIKAKSVTNIFKRTETEQMLTFRDPDSGVEASAASNQTNITVVPRTTTSESVILNILQDPPSNSSYDSREVEEQQVRICVIIHYLYYLKLFNNIKRNDKNNLLQLPYQMACHYLHAIITTI